MRILFGPENDGRQTPDPAPSGAYEWWYFDALSDDGRYALVLIFFLGSPMSPYYKAVVQGRSPDPHDWCGVFCSLHERVGKVWRERAYAYNLYPGGEFPKDRVGVALGESRMEYDPEQATWTLSLNERGLWRGRITGTVTFALGSAFALPVFPENTDLESAHAWICAAPVCRVEAQLTLPAGGEVAFSGEGYHDHNQGILPFADFYAWYWYRVGLKCDDGVRRIAVGYAFTKDHLASRGTEAHLVILEPERETSALFFSEAAGYLKEIRDGRYGLRHAHILRLSSRQPEAEVRLVARLLPREGAFADGPFYRRLPVEVRASLRNPHRAGTIWNGVGHGIAEVFVPSRLCGPIASRALWTRIRRRGGAA